MEARFWCIYGENICIVNEDVNDTKGSKSLENYKNEENIKYDILSKNELAEEDILVKDKSCKRNKNIQNSESDNNNSSADSVEKSCSSEIKNPDSYSDLLGNSSGLSNFSSNQKQKFNINEESTFDSFVKPLDSHIIVIQRKNINNSFEQLSGSKENYENFSNKEQENSARTENILNSDKKCEPYITAYKLETPFVSNIYKAYEQRSESIMAERREVKWAENRNTGRDFFNEKELKYEARGSILENALDDNDALNNLLTPETHVTSPLMTLKNEAVQLLVTENSDKAEDVVSHTEPSTENASIRELSLGTENIPIKNTEFEDTKNMIERKFLINVSHQDEADATVSDSCGKLPSQITAFKNPEKESCHRLTPNEATSIKAKCDVSETDTKIPNVSEKNHNDTSSGCISRKSAGSTTEGKYIASTLPYSDTADESGDDVHFVLKKHRPSDINRRKDAEQRKTKACDENQFQMTNTMLHNTEQSSERKIALNYGKFAFCMDLYPESEIELVFKSSGKSMKRSTVYPFKGHK